jgi:transcriptional regulator with XRE-family HTH domain
MWSLKRKGFSQAEISRRMNVTRQTVNKTINVIDSKITKALLEAAQLNRINVKNVNSQKGFLFGRSMVFDMDVLVTFSERNGLQLWYKGEGGCSNCADSEDCKQRLIAEAEERGITLPDNTKIIEPARIADLLFMKIMEV